MSAKCININIKLNWQNTIRLASAKRMRDSRMEWKQDGAERLNCPVQDSKCRSYKKHSVAQ